MLKLQQRRSSFLDSLNEGVGRDLLSAYLVSRCDEARNALAMHYALCAQVVARQVYRGLTKDAKRRVELADVEQMGFALLFGVVERYDHRQGVPLSAFVVRRVRFGLIDQLRSDGVMVRAGRGLGPRPRMTVSLPAGLLDRGGSPVERAIEAEAGELHRCASRAQKTSARTAFDRRRAAQNTRARSDPAREAGVVPGELRRAKDFRRWAVLRLPWAYRKLVAYRYLRGRDIAWTAGRLGIAQDRAALLDRQARPMIARVVQEWRNGVVVSC